jgi:pimeloyl-ACP methyl ester carboxylesterase
VYILAGTQVQLASVAFGEGCEMPQISVHGLDAYYRDEGSGIPVLLGHSSTGSGGQWRGLFKRMSGRYRLIAPDLQIIWMSARPSCDSDEDNDQYEHDRPTD